MGRWAAVASVALILVVGVAALPASSGEIQQGGGLAYVNSEVILRQTPGYEAADSIMRAEMQVYQREIETLRTELDSAVSAFDQQSIVLSPAAREEKMEELRRLQERYNTRAQELQQRAGQREQELVAPLQQRIQAVIDGIRAERNLAIIFDVASPTSGVLSADPTLNLTQLVVTRVRAAGGQ
jgi:outer membrane protein